MRKGYVRLGEFTENFVRALCAGLILSAAVATFGFAEENQTDDSKTSRAPATPSKEKCDTLIRPVTKFKMSPITFTTRSGF